MKLFINNKKIQRDRVGKNFDSRGKQPKSFSKNTQNLPQYYALDLKKLPTAP